MYLSDRDIRWAIDRGRLRVTPRPESFDPTSIDLHLDTIQEAKIWNIAKYMDHESASGRSRPELEVARYNLAKFSGHYLVGPPSYSDDEAQKVGVRGEQVIIKPLGFVLWPVKEEIGTDPDDADLICFVDGKSTKARAGIVVHLTAPTIHASWTGNVVLEIVNLGPFDLVLQENDVIAQLTVAKITSPPDKSAKGTSQTFGQSGADGLA